MKFYQLGTMRTRILMQLVLLAVVFVSVSDVRADMVTFRFEGTLTSVDAPLQGTFSTGDSFEGTYTFDSDSPETEGGSDVGEFEFENAISAMSFSSGAYMASATNGKIEEDRFDDSSYFASFSPVSGSPVGDFVPNGMGVDWFPTNFGIPSGEPALSPTGLRLQPGFDPDLPPWVRDSFAGGGQDKSYFDGDGNLVFSPEEGVIGNPNQPLFFSNGMPAPTNGSFSFSFLDSEGQLSGVRGKLNSVTVAVNAVDGLIAHWPLNEGSGTKANDVTGNGFDGVLTRGPVWHGEDLLFDGIDDYVNVGAFNVPGKALTLTGWVYPDQLGNCRAQDCRIISKATDTPEQAHYWMLSTIKVGDKTRLRFRLKAGNSTSTLIASSGDLMDGELFHAAAVYDGATMRLYKNGIEVGSLAKTGHINSDGRVGVWIGGNPNVAISRPWKGLISDVRVYQKALTEEELETVMDLDAVDADMDTP